MKELPVLSLFDRWGNASFDKVASLQLSWDSNFGAAPKPGALPLVLWPLREYKVPRWSLSDYTPGQGRKDCSVESFRFPFNCKNVFSFRCSLFLVRLNMTKLEMGGGVWRTWSQRVFGLGSHILEQILDLPPNEAYRLNDQLQTFKVYYKLGLFLSFKIYPKRLKKEKKKLAWAPLSCREPWSRHPPPRLCPCAASYLCSLPVYLCSLHPVSFLPLSPPSERPLVSYLPSAAPSTKSYHFFPPDSGCLCIILICSSELWFSISSQT